jgi:hypothetical protein
VLIDALLAAKGARSQATAKTRFTNKNSVPTVCGPGNTGDRDRTIG